MKRFLKTFLVLPLVYGLFWMNIPALLGQDMSNCSNSKCHQKALDPLQKMAHQHEPFTKKLCDSCHAKEHKKFVDAPEKLCLQCHDNNIKKSFVHGPASAGSCTTCHNPHASDHDKMLVKPATEICMECHEVKPGAHNHKPVTEKQCTKCHSPHSADFKGLLVKDPTELCFQCHPQKTEEYGHGPYSTGACLGCHAPHSAGEDHLLTAPNKELCLSCHDNFIEKLNAPMVHSAIAKMGCTGCHDPHTSRYRYQLKKETKDLCLGCHDKIQKVVADAKFKHKPVTTDPACRSCHDPHSSNLNALLLKPEREICLSCHNQQLVTEETKKKLANIEAMLKNSKEQHGPIRENLCAPCHNPHGSEHFRLLRKPYPEQFYAPFDEKLYGLCFNCHNPQVVTTDKTTQLTNFRNGEQNLHYLHVNQKKGRTCRACHEVHASNAEKHIRYAVPFGKNNWELPLKFTKVETGGRCQPGCHKAYSYDRKNPVNNRAK